MKFSYHPRVILHLGTELISSDAIALTELIKNSYDAKATKINTIFFDSFETIEEKYFQFPLNMEIKKIIKSIANIKRILVVEDNGSGMNQKIINENFFLIGTDSKKKEKLKSEKIILGDKGIGRLAAQRLSPILILETSTLIDNQIYLSIIEWNKFLENTDASSQDFSFPKEISASYTRIWLIGQNENEINFNNFFEENTIDEPVLFGPPVKGKPALYAKSELEQALSFLFSPFQKNKAIIDLNLRYNKEPIKLVFQHDTLNIAEKVHSFSTELDKDKNILLNLSLEIKPWFIQRIHKSFLGKELYRDWEKDSIFYKSLIDKYKLRFSALKTIINMKEFFLKKIEKNITDEKIRKNYFSAVTTILPIDGKVYSFKRDQNLLNMAVNSALDNGYLPQRSKINDIRTFLNVNNGIKLYRNHFRVGVVGNTDNDWLKLQQESTKGQQFYRIELGNTIGYVNFNDPKQEYIFETSSREGIVDSDYSKSLLILLDYIFNDVFYIFSTNAANLVKDILKEENLLPGNLLKEIKEEKKKTEVNLKAAQKDLQAFQEAFKIIKDDIELDSSDKVNNVKKVLKNIKKHTDSFEKNFSETVSSLKSVNEIVLQLESKEKSIETELYNNFKLMANGLITEAITHELHSILLGSAKTSNIETHFDEIKGYLFKEKQYEINTKHLQPLKDNFYDLQSNITQINRFYQFLEKTFLTKGNYEDFEDENLKNYLEKFFERFNDRLRRSKINIDISSIDIEVKVPKGSLIHLFYNLIENSIYWIEQRQRKANQHDKSFFRNEPDIIRISKINDYSFIYFDSGTGVLPQYQETLFFPLVSGKDTKDARGMGLYIVKRFLESFGAGIILKNDVNEYGNRYIFEISFKKGENNEQ